MTMLPLPTSLHLDPWTWLRRVFPAKTFHSLERVPDFPANVLGCSGISYEPLAWWDGPNCCWRTWQGCLIEGWARFLGPWPRSGMMRNGIAFQRAPLVPLTGATASGLLPTPTARDGKDLSKTTAYLSARLRHSPSIATQALTAGVAWQNVPHLYEMAMGYPLGWSDLG